MAGRKVHGGTVMKEQQDAGRDDRARVRYAWRLGLSSIDLEWVFL